MVVGVITAVIGIAQQFIGEARLVDLGYSFERSVRTAGGYLRSFSTFFTNFPFALYLMLVLLIGIPSALVDVKRVRNRLFLFSIPVLVGGLLASITRAAWIGLAVGLVYVGVTRFRSVLVVLGHGVVWIALVLVVAGGVSGVFLSGESLRERVDIWEDNVSQVARHPLGQGIGSTGSAADKLTEASGKSTKDVLQPDNYYFKTTLELGVLGLWFLLFFFVTAFSSVHGAARSLRGYDGALATGVAASVLAAATVSVVATYFEVFPMDAYFWLLLAVVANVRARIALNALALRPGGSGVQTYIRELFRELAAGTSADLVAAVQADAVDELPVGVTPLTHPVAAGVRRALAGLRMPGDFDLVHGLDATLPVRVRAPTVVTFHDIAVFDVPWAFSRRRVIGKRVQLRHALRRADAVIAVSRFTAERIEARFRREAVVVPSAPPSDCAPPHRAAVEAACRRYTLPDRFVLHVGSVDPRKNLPGLSDACARAGLPLVLAGAVERGRVAGIRARFLGYVPRSELLALYGAATVVAYPSFYEGFGLPPLEAMACGAPVVATRVASLPELLGDAAVFVDVRDTDDLAAALRELANDDARRAELAAAGTARAATLSWVQTVRETADVYGSLGVVV